MSSLVKLLFAQQQQHPIVQLKYDNLLTRDPHEDHNHRWCERCLGDLRDLRHSGDSGDSGVPLWTMEWRSGIIGG